MLLFVIHFACGSASAHAANHVLPPEGLRMHSKHNNDTSRNLSAQRFLFVGKRATPIWGRASFRKASSRRASFRNACVHLVLAVHIVHTRIQDPKLTRDCNSRHCSNGEDKLGVGVGKTLLFQCIRETLIVLPQPLQHPDKHLPLVIRRHLVGHQAVKLFGSKRVGS